MSGGKITKEAKERYLREDIELHRQRTLNKYCKPKKKLNPASPNSPKGIKNEKWQIQVKH